MHMNKMKALAAQLAAAPAPAPEQVEQPQTKKKKLRIRVTFDLTTGVINTPIRTFRVEDMYVGQVCPKCLGADRYVHLDGRRGKCHCCNSNGRLTHGDVAYNKGRKAKGLHICTIVTKLGQPWFN